MDNHQKSDMDFQLLALRYLDGVHSEADARALSAALQSSAKKRAAFAALSVEVGLLGEMRDSNSASQSRLERPPVRFSRTAAWWSIAAVLLVSAFPIYRLITTPQIGEGPVMLADSESSEPAISVSSEAGAWVARVVRSSPEVAWSDESRPTEFLLRVRSGDRMHLKEGLVELEFHSGAQIILHGPAVFTPTGESSGHLESGKLTGEVSNGNFRLLTPAAEIIDLGTAFGVVANDDLGTDVVVFDGRVQVVSRNDSNKVALPLDMAEGMAARFRADGTTEYGVNSEAHQFVRAIPANSALSDRDELCLIDLMAGGDGLGTRLAGAIDPSTGSRDYSEKGRKLRLSQRRTPVAFHAVEWHQMIDGVFVPTASGSQVQIDSAGGSIDLPRSEGFTWGSLWVRRRESTRIANSNINHDFWGARTLDGIVQRLEEVERGLIGIHANAGVTFDLRKIQMVHRQLPIEFRGSVDNIENSADWAPHEMREFKRTVNFHIFVDGQPRYERLVFRREDGDERFVVPLLPDDRFLTVVATDDGNIEFDHVVLIDPVIALRRE